MNFLGKQPKQTSTRFLNYKTDRRMWQRIPANFPLVFLNEAQQEFPGKISNISAGGLCFLTKNPPSMGEFIICYVEKIGRISGTVVRRQNHLVCVRADTAASKRDKLADLLTYIANKDKYQLDEARRAPRESTGQTGRTIVETEDGRICRCMITDMSFVGAALTTKDARPLIGEVVKVGQQRGRIARYFDKDGFAVDFTRK